MSSGVPEFMTKKRSRGHPWVDCLTLAMMWSIYSMPICCKMIGYLCKEFRSIVPSWYQGHLSLSDCQTNRYYYNLWFIAVCYLRYFTVIPVFYSRLLCENEMVTWIRWIISAFLNFLKESLKKALTAFIAKIYNLYNINYNICFLIKLYKTWTDHWDQRNEFINLFLYNILIWLLLCYISTGSNSFIAFTWTLWTCYRA